MTFWTSKCRTKSSRSACYFTGAAGAKVATCAVRGTAVRQQRKGTGPAIMSETQTHQLIATFAEPVHLGETHTHTLEVRQMYSAAAHP